MTLTHLFRSRPVVAALLAVPAWCVHAEDAAQDASASDPPGDAAPRQVIVTGSNLRRTDRETPSPVQVLTADDIRRSGYTSVGDVLHSLTSNNMGSLTQAAPSAFAAGGSGVALRGLTVGATLVLIDGHRMASYPMPDDGERDFVDIASIPLEAIERIEVLKDGASAVYGSDAIAGVVNVILKKSVVGTRLAAETGLTARGDGATRHASLSTGWGDLDRDGRNAYVVLEARHQDAILLRNRPYLARTDWTPYGGVDLTQGTNSGATSGASSGAGSGGGYLVDANGQVAHYYGSCNATAAAADACGYTNPSLTIQPATTNLDALGRFTARLGGGWQGNLQASVLRSEARQASLYNNAAATGVGSGGNGGGVNLFRFGPGVAPTPAFPDRFPFVLTVPANYPGNPTGGTAALVDDFLDIGPITQDVTSTSWRNVGELDGAIGAWDLNLALGWTKVATTVHLGHDIDFPALQAALDDGSYQVDGTNSAAVLARVAPSAQSTSTNDLGFLGLRGTRVLATLPGGPLSLGLGTELMRRRLHEQFPSSFANGSQSVGIYAFAEGGQTDAAAYTELVAPVLQTLELDAAARFDRDDQSHHALTPKAGFKFTPTRSFALRGTFSEGFRAPDPAETGNAGSTSGFVGNLHDPTYCPGGHGPVANLPPGMLDPCHIALQELQLSTPHLKPERSRSFTLGAILAPDPSWSATLDYYRIAIRDQIISVGQLGQQGLDDAAALGTTIYRDASGNILYDTYPFINADTTTTSGLDLDLAGRYDLHGNGRLKAELQVTWMMQYDLSAQGTTYHLAGTHGPAFVSEDTGTPRTRAAFTLTWERGPFELSGTVNYISHFSVTDPSNGVPDCATALSNEFPDGNAPSRFCRVASFTELNVTARYEVDRHLQVHLGVVNLLNRHAPYDLQTFGSAGNGAQQGGAPYNPSYHQDGAIGPMITVGAAYRF